MNVDAKDTFLNRVNDVYNQEVYFIEPCYRFPNKYAAIFSMMDAHLRAYFDDNNKIVLACGDTVKYCEEGINRRIKITNITLDTSTDVNIINNYITEDKWKQIDW